VKTKISNNSVKTNKPIYSLIEPKEYSQEVRIIIGIIITVSIKKTREYPSKANVNEKL